MKYGAKGHRAGSNGAILGRDDVMMFQRTLIFLCLVWCMTASWQACSGTEPNEVSTPEQAIEHGVDAAVEHSAQEQPTERQAQPEPKPDTIAVAPSHTQWRGDFTQRPQFLRLKDGSLLLLVGIKGKAQLGQTNIDLPTTSSHCFMVKVTPNGQIQWLHHLFSQNFSICHLRAWQLGETVAIQLPNVGLISPARQKLQQPFPGQYESYILQISLATGELLPQGVTFSGTVNVVRGDDDRLLIGGHCAKGLFVAFNKAQASRAPKARPNQPLAKEGNACLAVVERKTEKLQLWMLDGSATSGIDDLHIAADGSLYIIGGFGGYQQDMDAIFDLGEPTQRSLLNFTADDDPSWDVYVAKLTPQLKLQWAKPIMAYHNFVHRFGKIAPWKQGIVVYVHTDRAFSVWLDKGTANEQELKSSLLVTLEPTGKRSAFFRVEGVKELLPTKDGLLIWGGHPFPVAFGKNGERKLPSSESLQRSQRAEVSYLLKLDDELNIKQFLVGGWVSSESQATVLSNDQIWLLLRAGSFTVDEGLTTTKSFGQDNDSRLHLLPWRLQRPVPP